jgi:galactose mutarotase-like enzyme
MTRETDFQGVRAHVLRAADGTEATVVPSIGANCIALRAPRPDGGGMAHLLSTPPTPAALRGHPTGSGFPIPLPHPGFNRAPFVWRGRTYEAPDAKDRLPGHGFAAGSAWEVIDATDAALGCRLDTRTLDPAAAWWPWPFTFTATYRVDNGALTLELELDNVGDEPAPLLCGLHPYFPLRFVAPVDASGLAGGAVSGGAVAASPTAAELVGEDEPGARHTCRVWVDADALQDPAHGRATAALGAIGERWDVRRPRSLADLASTAAQAGVAHEDGRMPVLLYATRAALESASTGDDPAAPGGVTSGVVDAASGLMLTLETSRAFGALALYTPPRHAAVSLEPRSALPDALTLAVDEPHLATGRRAVEPGRPWRAWARLSLAPWAP